MKASDPLRARRCHFLTGEAYCSLQGEIRDLLEIAAQVLDADGARVWSLDGVAFRSTARAHVRIVHYFTDARKMLESSKFIPMSARLFQNLDAIHISFSSKQ